MGPRTPTNVTPGTTDEESFVRGLVERSEAALPDQNGNLPPGATHEIIGHQENGLPIVRERRKSLY
jgi:hypothetical protein